MSEAAPPALIPCETVLLEKLNVVTRVFPILDSDGSEIACPGNLWITNFRIAFKALQSESKFAEALSDFDFPLGWITKVEKIKPKGNTKFKGYTLISTFYGMSVTLRFPINSGMHKEVLGTLNNMVSSPSTLKSMFCFSNEEPPEAAAGIDGWSAFKPSKEYARMQLDVLELKGVTATSQAVLVDGKPQVSKFKLCVPYEPDRAPHGVPLADWPDMYPTFGVVVPMMCDNRIHFAPAGKVREEKQVPVIVWSNNAFAGVLGRGMIAADEGVNLPSSSSKYDYEPDSDLLEKYSRRVGNRALLVEVGGARAVPAMQAINKHGFEFQFLSLPSNSDLAKDWAETQQNFLKKIDQAPWWRTADAVLKSVGDLASVMIGGRSVFVLGSKRNYMHAPIVSLLQIVLDPHYRTIQGLATLLQKDWVDFTFPFFQHTVKDKGTLPHFELFLTCLWTLLISFPSSFEYSENLLLFLLDNIMSGRFGTFLAQSTRDLEVNLIAKTPSIWTWVLTHVEEFKNSFYVPTPANAGPAMTRLSLDEVLSTTTYWTKLFLRYEWDQLSDSVRAMTVMPPSSTRFIAPGSLRNLSWLPGSLFARITTLSIPDNKIFSPQWEMLSSTTLEDINLTHNPLSTLPSEFLKVLGKNCPQLRSLVLDRTRCTVYPSNIHIYIPSLRELRMKNVATAPRTLTFLPAAQMDVPVTESFQTLDISENNLSTLIPKFINVWSLTSLDLSGNSFATIPTEISYLQRLRDLKFSMNKMNILSSGRPNLHMLESLDVSNNSMHVIPEEVCPSFGNLKVLDLSFNKLKVIPASFFARIPLLEVLNLSQNVLTSLPAAFGTLERLTQVDLSYNQFESFPDAVTNAVNLQIVNVSNNQLKDLPVAIGRLKQLRTLNVSHNKMRSFPPQLGLMADTIQTFIWDGNPLEIQQEVLSQGGHGVLEFLRDLMSGAKPCFRMKLMIVGEENVGKSTLTEQLVKRWQSPWSEVQIDPNKNISTDGVEISSATFEWFNDGPKAIPKFKQGENIPVQLSLWDFGGQTVYYTTHQFFLSERSLFLVLYNLERPIEDSRVDYWLNSIQSKVRAASVIIVGTHLDGLKKDKRDELDAWMRTFKVQYRTQYPTLDLGFQAISARTGEGVPELKDLIEKRVMNSKNMGEMLPESYLLLERSIMEERRLRNPPILSKAKFTEIGHLCNIKDERELSRASSLLHNLGTIIYFDKDPTLSQYVILNPHFLARVFSTLITTKHRFVMGGIIPHSALIQIWLDYPQETYSFLLGLLEKFEVVYTLSGQNGRFVIPEAARRLMEKPGSPQITIKSDEGAFAPSRHTMMDVSPSQTPSGRPTSSMQPMARRHTVQDSPDTAGLSDFERQFAVAAHANNNAKRALSPDRQRAVSVSPTLMTSEKFQSAKPRGQRAGSLAQRGITIGGSRNRSATSGSVLIGQNVAGSRRSSYAPPPTSLSPPPVAAVAPPTSSMPAKQNNRLSLMVSNDALSPEPSTNSSKSGFDPNGYSLVPSALDPSVPTGVADIWPTFPPYDQNEVNRSYRFSFLPQGFFSRLMVRLLQRFQGSSASDSTFYWSNGILMSRGSEIIFATMIPEQLRLDVFVRGGPFDKISPIFCAIIEAMSLLLREWGSISVKQCVLCSHCRRANFAEPTEFPIENLTASVRAKLDAADCVRFTGGLHPAPPEVLQKLFAANVSASKSSSRPISPAPAPASPPAPVVAMTPAAAVSAADDFQKQMDDFAAQMEALLGGGAPSPSPSPSMVGAVALPGMAAPTPARPAAASPVPTVAVSPPPNDADVEDYPVLNAVKQALMDDPNTICTEVRLDLLVPDLKLVYLKGNLVKWDDLAIEKQIGRGGFAIVYKGLYKGEVVAIKKLEVKDDDPDGSEEDSAYAKAFAEFRKEAFIMTQITDPHCVVLKGVCLDPFALITEFVPYGDLYSIVNKPDKFPMDWNLRLKIALDMAKGMQFMHAQQPPIIHNDLKTPNVLMMSLDSTAPVCAKVSDFGLSMQVSKMYKRLVDNPVWTAPEIMMGQTYTERADVYAYGVMLWELLERKQYFSHVPFNSDLEIRVMAGERSPITQDCMPEFEKLIRMCWDQTPSRRPDFPTIVKILELLIKKCNMGLAVIGPSSEMAAKPPPLVAPQVAAAPAAASPKQMVKSMSTNQIARSPSVELKPNTPPSPGTMRRDRGPTPLPSRSPSTEVRPNPTSQEPPAAAIAPAPASPQPAEIAAPPSAPATVIPPMQQPPAAISAPLAAAPTVTSPAAPAQQAPPAAGDSVLKGPSGNIRVAAIGGSGTSDGAIQSLQDQLKSNVKRAPSMSQSGNPPPAGNSAAGPGPAGPKKMMPGPGSLKSPLKQSTPGAGPAKAAPGQGPAPAKQPVLGPGSLKSSSGVKVPAGGLKKGPAVAPAAGTAATASDAQNTTPTPPPRAAEAPAASESVDDPTLAAIISASGVDTIPEGATDIETIRSACLEVETALKTGTLKSFGVLKILGGEEARESDDQVEKAIVEVVQLVRSMRTGNQVLMEADTSGVDSAQYSRQEAAAESAQAVIDALLVFCRSAKALDGAQRGLLTANDVGDVDIDSVREQSAAFAAAVKSYLTVLRPIKEWFKNTKARFFFPVSS
eukprot:TRINITY_DN13520_c0_g1_i1.p1 TRINITY_DN13520_c0_g1~~TRINITY_DN13520_c0_g1_i1.p1  ORF type:complete len:2607 (+),score=540.72 TRINITY_DN13520_c0_g1_i1:119-7939(+)